jgi:hypothetical protein
MDAMKQKQINLIKEGMDVYDAMGDKVGKVDVVHIGSDTNENEWDAIIAPQQESGYTFPVVVGKIMRDTKIPEPIRQRWLREGFMKVDAGLLRKDRYVHADQIDMVTERMVRLNVKKDDLSTF